MEQGLPASSRKIKWEVLYFHGEGSKDTMDSLSPQRFVEHLLCQARLRSWDKVTDQTVPGLLELINLCVWGGGGGGQTRNKPKKIMGIIRGCDKCNEDSQKGDVIIEAIGWGSLEG